MRLVRTTEKPRLLARGICPSEVGGKGLGDLFSPTDKGFDAFLELAARQQHTMVTLAAFDADVGSQAYYPPLITAARVWFSQTNHVTQSDLHNHHSTTSLDELSHYITPRLLWLIGGLRPLHTIKNLPSTAKAPKLAKIVTLCYSWEHRYHPTPISGDKPTQTVGDFMLASVQLSSETQLARKG